jgi:hypothetical protein
MLIKIFVRTFSSNEDCELFESILETRWPNLLQSIYTKEKTKKGILNEN